MSTATLKRPTAQHSSNYSGTVGMLRLYLRRDRLVLPLWALLLSVPLATVYVGSIVKVYPDQAARAAFAATIMASRLSVRSTARSTTTASAPPRCGRPECSTC